MQNAMSELLDRYEAGLMSRRELLGALVGIALPSTFIQHGKPLIGTATQLNHVTLHVQDVSRSQQFYQSLFGMPVLTHQHAGVNLRAGAGFVGLYPAGDGGHPGIDHLCLSIDHFDAAMVLRELEPLNLNAEIVRRGDTEELYFDDPDGITVQIQDTSYRGGVGRLGNRNP